ncbi:MAG: hypothetical protein KDC70_09175 [Saprospiraceae bacterium]|nr:hypothetical protein [Saprospiraceae bacterium]
MERTMSASAYGIARKHELLQATLLPQLAGNNTIKSLRCDVVFGSPSVGCRGTGICKLNANGVRNTAALRQSCRGASALLVPLDDGRGVSIVIPRAFLCVNILRNQLRHDVLKLTEPCPIPQTIVDTLGLEMKTLPPGAYPVTQYNGLFRIDIK